MSSKPVKASSALGDSSSAELDVAKVMAEIRSRIEADIESNRDKRRPLKPFSADFNSASGKTAGELDASESLRYLNTHLENGMRLDLSAITSHRPGLVGRVIVGVKRKALSLLWNHLIKYYVQSEKEYQSHLIKYLNEVSKYIDGRDASNFWELIRKIDVDVARAMTRIERIGDEQSGTVRTVENRVMEEVLHLGEKLRALDSVASGLERIVGSFQRATSGGSAMSESGVSEIKAADPRYLLLENRFRGSESEIKRRLSFYPEIFQGAQKPILEIGPGRGELQELFAEGGVKSYGIDLDRAMVETAAAKGLDVREGDAIAHLRALPSGSLGGVIAVQVVEHLTRTQIEDLCLLARDKVQKGGRIVFETINPQSVSALSSNYFRDPTHVWPLHPDTLSFSMTLCGLKVNEVRLLSPMPPSAKLQPIPHGDGMSQELLLVIDGINRNLDRLNGLLYGHQDYCVIAEVV